MSATKITTDFEPIRIPDSNGWSPTALVSVQERIRFRPLKTGAFDHYPRAVSLLLDQSNRLAGIEDTIVEILSDIYGVGNCRGGRGLINLLIYTV